MVDNSQAELRCSLAKSTPPNLPFLRGGMGYFILIHPLLSIFQNEVGINAHLSMKTFGKRHRNFTTATHYLAKL